MASILLLEDDLDCERTLRRVLSDHGHMVQAANSGADARAMLALLRPELIILDLGLPDIDGLLLVQTLKSASDAAILICSARSGQTDRVLGLKMGADDFVAKPFDLEELEARVEGLLRCAQKQRAYTPLESTELHVKDLTIELKRVAVTIHDRRIHLTPTEFRLLSVLASKPDTVFERAALASHVWGYTDAGCNHLIDVHIGRLRSKLRSVPAESAYLVSVRGRGYRLLPEVDCCPC
jgi:DNA-binding response OmpR family regulator